MENNGRNLPVVKAVMKRDHLTMNVDKEEFAMALKTWRLRNNLTQKEVAERWGVSRWTLLRAEKCVKLSWTIAYRLFAKLAKELQEEKL